MFQDVKNNINLGLHTLVIGDFNVNLMNWQAPNVTAKVEEILELNQIINCATTKGNTLLDHCFTHFPIQWSTVYTAWSYHFAITFQFNLP